jgi:uracil-DNA glycosylase
MKIPLNSNWQEKLNDEMAKPYFDDLMSFVEQEMQTQTVYPSKELIFNALNMTVFDDVKVVILGQDPYHGPNQAHGLCFSVQQGIKPPPSLANIYKELHRSTDFEIPPHGELTNWAKQGILMINATLTVRDGEPKSHAKKGWEKFTNSIIKLISDEKENVVFVLWGGDARKKAKIIDSKKHNILECAHPSPLSVYRGFSGCNHFNLINEYLVEQDKAPINWQV